MSRHSLQRRYALLFVTLTASAVFLLGIGVYFQFGLSQRNVNNSARDAMTNALFTAVENQGINLAEYLADNLANPLYRLDLNYISQLLRAAKEQKNVNYVYVFDLDGRVLHDGTPTLEKYGSIVDKTLANRAFSQNKPVASFDRNGLHVVMPIRIGSQLLGGLVIELSLEDMDRRLGELDKSLTAISSDTVKEYFRYTVTLSAVLLLISLILSITIARNLTTPIRQLSAITRQIGHGDYEIIRPFSRQDELGELADSLRGMALRLKETTVSRTYLDNILKSMLDALLVLDQEGVIKATNDAAGRLLEYRNQELISRHISQVIELTPGGQEGAGALAKILADALPKNVEGNLIRYDGIRIPALISLSPMHQPGWETPAMVCVVRDITERKRIEEQYKRARDLAERASHAKSEFLANMSHELRTPLNAILGFSEVIERELLGPLDNPKYRTYAADIYFSGTHLLQIIDDLLDMAKVESGKMAVHAEPVDIHTMVDAVRRIVAGRAEEAHLSLSFVLPDIPITIHADERMMRQILINLLSNAIKFTPAGGLVSLSVQRNAAHGVDFSVRDTGIGIKKEDIPRILVPFTRLEETFRRKYPGTGLGLPLSASFVRMHGGTIAIHSEPDQGTEIRFDLPASRVIEGEADLIARSATSA